MNSEKEHNLCYLESNQSEDCITAVHKPETEDGHTPPAKRQKTESSQENLVQSTNIEQSDVGSSSMHAHQVVDQSVVERVKEAVEWFYFYAYKWFNLAFNKNKPSNVTDDSSCIASYTAGNGSSLTFLSPEDISNHFSSELSNGESTTAESVEAWTNAVIDSYQFKHLCPSCDGLFKSTEHFEDHFVKNKDGNIRCPFQCRKVLVNFRRFQKHLETVHMRERSKRVRDFKCHYEGCKKAFLTAKDMRCHAIYKHGFQCRKCKICHKDFATKETMKAHVLAEHGLICSEQGQFQCDIEGCDKRFKTLKGRDNHKAIAHKVYPENTASLLRCTEKNCGKRFKTIEGLMNHTENKHWK